VNLRRVWIVYRKELLEALRDRRTLIAMILVPLLLYPVIMIVVVQALHIEKTRRERETYTIVVPDEPHREWLTALLREDDREEPPDDAPPPRPGDPTRAVIRADQFDVRVADGPLDARVRSGAAAAALEISPPPDPARPDVNLTIDLFYDPAEFRSEVASRALRALLTRHADRTVRDRLAGFGVTADALRPLEIEPRSVASPRKLGGALLGQILPFLLVIMTVTGAIYPAIDLTAGERERGTLETLMVAPVPASQIVAGKFLVVVTIALFSSALNLASMGATVRFGGVADAMSRALPGAEPIAIPVGVLPIVLLAMVPFAVLFSALMLATCSIARTFKEAQNYMTPVMMAALIPAMITSYMPSVRLTGLVTVLPVANVVVMVRELFLGHYSIAAMLTAFLSTSFYALAAVAFAARLFGQEAVLFSDVGSYRSLLSRRFLRPAPAPSAASALLLLAVIFPLSFHWQAVMAGSDLSSLRLAATTLVLMLGCYLVPTVGVAWYAKLDLRRTFSLRVPRFGACLGAVLVGSATPVLAYTLGQWLLRQLPPPEEIVQQFTAFEQRLAALGTPAMLLLFALLPGVCEEMLFRGYLLAGLRARFRPAALCVVVGLLFGLFHVDVYRVLTAGLLGVVLTYVCWRSGSVLPAILIHVMHNGVSLLAGQERSVSEYVAGAGAPPPGLILTALAALAAGLMIVRMFGRYEEAPPEPS